MERILCLSTTPWTESRVFRTGQMRTRLWGLANGPAHASAPAHFLSSESSGLCWLGPRHGMVSINFLLSKWLESAFTSQPTTSKSPTISWAFSAAVRKLFPSWTSRPNFSYRQWYLWMTNGGDSSSSWTHRVISSVAMGSGLTGLWSFAADHSLCLKIDWNKGFKRINSSLLKLNRYFPVRFSEHFGLVQLDPITEKFQPLGALAIPQLTFMRDESTWPRALAFEGFRFVD